MSNSKKKKATVEGISFLVSLSQAFYLYYILLKRKKKSTSNIIR